MDKLYASKAFLKMGGGRMYTPHPSPLDPPLAISYRNHQKSLAYFSHLAPSISFFFTERQRQKGGHDTIPPKCASAWQPATRTAFTLTHNQVSQPGFISGYETSSVHTCIKSAFTLVGFHNQESRFGKCERP